MSGFTLTLSPAWGGTAFGPFDGTAVQLGSDASSCQIQLGSELGVAPLHAVIWRGADGSFGLQPATQGAAVYLFSQGNPLARPVTSAVQAHLGDAFALVSPQGPRFTLGETQAVRPAPRPMGGGRSVLPSASAMEREVRRQVTSRLGAGPLGGVNQLLHKLRSGQLMQPRYILAGLVALVAGAAAVISQLLGLG